MGAPPFGTRLYQATAQQRLRRRGPCAGRETRQKRGGVGTWSHPAVGRGSGFPLSAMTPWNERLSAGFPLCSQDCTTCGHAPARFIHLREMVQSGSTCSAHDALDGVMSAGRMSTHASGKRSQERIHGVNQILPGRFHGLLKFCQLGVVGVLKVSNAPLELCKARAYIFKFPVMLELDADLLLGESPLKLRHTGRQILDFPDNLVQARFLQQHDRLSTPERNRTQREKTLAEQKAVDSPKGSWAKGLKTGWMKICQRENRRTHGWKNANTYGGG